MKSATRRAGSLGFGALLLSFIALAILRFDMIVSVRYVPAKVNAVQYLPQMGMHSRAVLVDLPDQRRVIRTHDRHIQTLVGAKVCVAEHSYLLRSFVRRTLELSVYCPGMQAVVRPTDGPPVIVPGD